MCQKESNLNHVIQIRRSVTWLIRSLTSTSPSYMSIQTTQPYKDLCMSFNDQLKSNDSSVYSRIIPMSCLMSPTLSSPHQFCQVVSSVLCDTPFLSHRFVLDEGVEPSRPFGHPHLKRARLPFRQSSMNQNLIYTM